MTKSGTRAKVAQAPVSRLDAALADFEAATRALNEAEDECRANRKRLAELRTLISGAAQAEKFEEAAKLKRERDMLESQSNSNATNLREVASKAHETLNQLYFEEHPVHLKPTCVTVTRVVVVDPRSHDSVEEVYIDSSDNVCFRLRDKSFDSEAYHVGEWAREHGFLVHWSKKAVEV